MKKKKKNKKERWVEIGNWRNWNPNPHQPCLLKHTGHTSYPPNPQRERSSAIKKSLFFFSFFFFFFEQKVRRQWGVAGANWCPCKH